MDNKGTLIITGSDGFIGSYLVAYFSALGFQVRAFQQKQERLNDPHIGYYQFELGNIEDRGFAGASHLIHCAYESKAERKNKNTDINLEGTKNLISLCRKYNIKPIFISTLSAHAETESEDARTKLAMEGLFDVTRDLIVKPGFILGGGGLFARISSIIKNYKIVPLVGGGEQYIQTLAIDDLAQVVAAGIERNISGCFAVAHPMPVRMNDLYREVAKALNVRRFFVPLPIPVVLYVLTFAETIGLHLPVSSENVFSLKQLKIFDTKNDLATFGVTTKGLQETLAGMTFDNRLFVTN